MPTIDTFLFDLDGTLIDSIELILRSFRHTLRQHNQTVPPDRVWLAGIGTPLRTQLRAFAREPAELESLIATYRNYTLAHHDDLVRPYPGITSALESLKAAAGCLAVVTSKARAGMHRGLEVCGLTGLFDAHVAADDVSHHKPHPAPVLKALELLGADPSRTVFVGDSPHDMASGRAAGVRTAAALWGPFQRSDLELNPPDHWLTQPSEIATFATTTNSRG